MALSGASRRKQSPSSKGEDEKLVVSPVHQFEDAKSYEEFQKLREEYLLLTVAEVKAAAGEGDGVEAVDPALVEPLDGGGAGEESVHPVEAEVPAFEPSEELKGMEKKLIADYSYDPQKNYQIDLEKTALYARPGG